MIANHCRHLCGLNLRNILVEDVESQLGLWEILSNNMNLTHLAIGVCFLRGAFGAFEQTLISLFQKFTTLRALQFVMKIGVNCVKKVKSNGPSCLIFHPYNTVM